MRVSCLSNFYPPLVRGGYELWCQEVSDRLRARGHDVHILTSRTGPLQTVEDEASWVHRDLYLEMEFESFKNGIRFFTSRKSRERENLSILKSWIERISPDAILIWGMWNLPRSLPALAEKLMPGKVAYYFGDYWPILPSQFEAYWASPAQHWTTKAIKRWLRGFAHQMMSREHLPSLKFEHALFPTEFMHQEFLRKGIVPQNFRIINGAVDTARFITPKGGDKKSQNWAISLLYVGRLTFDKGVHTAIEAMSELVNHHQVTKLNLQIVGSGDKSYETYLRGITKQFNIEEYVKFIDSQPIDNLPEIYHKADILLFTSIWPEPFGRVLIEAMAAGLPIIGTATGGAAEILIENENALLFSPGDPISLAGQILKSTNSPQLMNELSDRGQHLAVEKYGIDKMASGIEAYLSTMTKK